MSKNDKKLEAPSKKKVPIKFRRGEDDGTGRLAMEDVYASGYKVKSYVDPETGETKTRKVRAHRIEFKNSGMGAKPEITKEEKMKKTFSQFKEEYGLDEAKFAKGGIPSAPNTGNRDDGYTKRQRQRAAKKRAEEITKQRRQRAMGEELNLEDFSLEEIEEFMMSEEYGLDEAKFAKGGIPSAPNTGNKDDGYTKRQRQRAAKKRAEELTKQRREREMKEELNLEDFSLEEIEEFMMSEEFEQLDELSKQRLGQYIRLASRDASRAAQSAELHKRTGDEAYSKLAKAAQKKRQAGIDKATHRLAKEELDLDEAAWPKSFDRSRRTGDETATSHSVTKTSTGTKYSKMFDPDGISKGTGDDAAKAAEGVKRGRGRPRKNPLPSGHQAAADLQGLMGSKLPKKASKLPSTKHSMGEALEVLFDLDEETFNHMMEEYGLDASIEIIQNELDEGLQDDILAIAKKVSPNARVRPSVEQQKADRDEMIRKRMAAAKDKKQAPYKPHEKYPLGGHDPVSNRSYSD